MQPYFCQEKVSVINTFRGRNHRVLMFCKEELEWSLVGDLYREHKVQLWGE